MKSDHSLGVRKQCINVKFADFDNCNLVMSETVFVVRV